MNERLVDLVRRLGTEHTAEEIADALWLARHLPSAAGGTGGPAPGAGGEGGPDAGAAPDEWGERDGRGEHGDATGPAEADGNAYPGPDPAAGGPGGAPYGPGADVPGGSWWPVDGRDPGRAPATVDAYLPDQRLPADEPAGVRARVPRIRALDQGAGLGRALRPLRRRVDSRREVVLDEAATARVAAETDAWLPVLRPAPARWLSVDLVLDDAGSMPIWQPTVGELRTVFERLGAFRDVRVWHLDSDAADPGRLRGGRTRHQARELVDPTASRAVLVVSDCVGTAWGDGRMARLLERWGRAGPTAVVQLLPQGMWASTRPHLTTVQLRAPAPGVPNSRLSLRAREPVPGVAVPVLELSEERHLAWWADLVAGRGQGWSRALALVTGRQGTSAAPAEEPEPEFTTAEQLAYFRETVAPETYRLAVYLSAAPLQLPVMRLVQAAMLPGSPTARLAELYLSGLLGIKDPSGAARHADEIEYEFEPPGVREELLSELDRQDALRVLREVSRLIAPRLGSPEDFLALLTTAELPPPAPEAIPFATIATQVLRTVGGRFAEAAERLAQLTEIARTAQPARPASISHPDDSWESVTHRTVDITAGSTGDDVTEIDTTPAAPRQPAEASRPSIWGGVPRRNPAFTGRDALIDRLHEMLTRSSAPNRAPSSPLMPSSLHGLGGVGKTQVAIEYVYRYQHEYDLVWWITAEEAAEIRQSLVELARRLRLPVGADVRQTVRTVLEALRTGRPFARWLLVFDNADSPDEIKSYLPEPTGHLIVTSRNRAWYSYGPVVRVNVFSREESRQLLRHQARGISDGDADELAERLGDLPLALEQAAAWYTITGMQVGEYIRLLDEQRAEILGRDPRQGAPSVVAETWSLAIDRLKRQSPTGAQLLEVCAFFGAEPISFDLLRDARGANIPPPLGPALASRLELRSAIGELSRYSLVTVDPETNSIQIHRLVQRVIKAGLDNRYEATELAAQRILAAANPGRPDDSATWPKHRALSPHLVSAGMIEAEDPLVARAILHQIRYRYAIGDNETSRVLAAGAADAWAASRGQRDELTLLARRHLANALRALGDSEPARRLNQETFRAFQESFGPDHEHTLAIGLSVGADLRGIGRFEEAHLHDDDNLERHRRMLGDDDRNTLRAKNNHAVDLRLLGRFAEARASDEELIATRRRIFPADDALTLAVVTSLVRDLYGLGEYEEALERQKEIMPALESNAELRNNDDELIAARRNLVMIMRKLDEGTQACALARDNLLAQQRLAPYHEHLLFSTMSLSLALVSVGEPDEAIDLGMTANEHYLRHFGERHPFTLACQTNLAVAFRRAGEPDRAAQLDEVALEGLTATLGEGHPYTLSAASNLAVDHAARNEVERALVLSAATLERSVATRGASHPDTLTCRLNHGLNLHARGDEGAERVYGSAVQELTVLFGPAHSAVRAALAHRHGDCDIEPPPT